LIKAQEILSILENGGDLEGSTEAQWDQIKDLIMAEFMIITVDTGKRYATRANGRALPD
jgi:hypothetical protein